MIVRSMEDETLVYDLRSHRAHCLNGPAAKVWLRCDGEQSLDAIARSAGMEEVDVEVALVALAQARLLEAPYAPRTSARMMTRRGSLRALGALVPAVATVLAPRAASAASCLNLNKNCKKNNPPPCCPGLTCRDVQVGNSTQQRCVP